MKWIRRLLQVVALVGTLMIGTLAVALIVSQTPWFKDWLRRYVVRESKQYLNGELSIGALGGNLLFGVQLADVAVDVSGERVVAVKNIEVDYSVFDLISKGMVLDEIKLHQPVLVLERDAQGWSLGRLVKEQRKEADREGPGRPVSLPSIEVTDASVTIPDGIGVDGVRLPRRIDDLDVRAGFEYAPVHYTIDVEHLSFRGASPQFAIRQLAGRLAVRDDNLYLEQVSIHTSETKVAVEGVVEDYLGTPVLKLTTTGNVSMPEIGRVVPAAAGYDLHPSFTITAEGPAERLGLTLDVQSEAGAVNGQLTADVQTPDFAVEGEVAVDRLNLAPLLKDPAQRSDITGQAKLDVRLATREGAPATERMDGTFEFAGPRVLAAGYEARDVRVTGSLAGPRVNLDGRAAAYGGTATAKGFIVTPAPGRPLSFDIRGAADNLDLRNLPAATGAPQLATDLSVAEYRIAGTGRTIEGSARLNPSTVEGARLGEGTTATFAIEPGAISYTAAGSMSELDLQRLGRGLGASALDKPAYASRINGTFDVAGSLPRTGRTGRTRGTEPSTLSTLTLAAKGTLTDSDVLGGRLPRLAFDAQLNAGALKAHADGTFEGFNPGALSGRKDLEGKVSGQVNATVAVADLSAPITPDAIQADGSVSLTDSTVGGLRIDSAAVEGRLAQQVADLTTLAVSGPDVKVEASGRMAMDRTSASNLKYHVEAVDLPALAKLAGQEGVSGTAVLDGTVTGNRAALTLTGTLDGSNLGYQENNALDLNSTYTVTVPDLQFAQARVEATTDATFVKAAGLQLTSLHATTTYAEKQIDFATNLKEEKRELDAKGQVILHPDHQEIHLPELVVRTQGIEWRTVPGSDAAVRYGGNRIELQDVKLVSGNQSLEVAGTLALGTDTPAGEAPATGQIEVHARNVDLQQLETILLQNRGMTGTLNADATIAGSSARPVVDGRVEIRDGGFQTYQYQSLTADVDYAGTRIGLDATLQQSPTEQITAKGSMPTSLFRATPGAAEGHVAAGEGENVDLHITSTAINLGFIQGFTTQVAEVQGTLEADVRVTGSGADPHLDGYIDIKNGAFGIPVGGVSYTGLDTRIELTPDLVRLQKFSIRDEHGAPLTVAGELAVHAKQVGAVNITISSDNFELIDNELGDVGVDSEVRITGELRRPRVEGDVRLEAARLEVDRLLQLFYDPYAVEALPPVVSAERTVEGSGSAEDATRAALAKAGQSATPAGDALAEQGEGPEAPGGIMTNLALDVRLRMPDNVVLRGQDLRPGGPTGAALGDMNITVGGDVRIRKEPGGKIGLVGTINTVRGTYEFQGRRFDLVRGGTLRFAGSPDMNPALDVTATRLIPNTGVEARVHVTGTAKAPELKLTSNPPLEESDILALIVFNRPVNELGTGERSSLAATAGGIATGFIAAPLGESIGKALDLDLFEITTTTDEGELGAGVTLGQQVGDRAFLKLRQQFGQRSLTEFILEYQLTDFLRLQGSAAPETASAANRINQRRVERAGIDLIFFFSY
jgi:autotransporter translocation and assembly factor TamB